MSKLRVLDLFSGIGGFSLGLDRAGGFETVAFCEIEPFCQKVLAKHWPGVPIYDDVRTLTGDTLARDGITVDVICGGFPCQDISTAGARAGMGEGTRSGLWSEIVRLMGDLRPGHVIVENVTALLDGPIEQRGGWFGRVLGDLAKIGYDAEWHCIRGTDVGVPQNRPRVWVVAYPSSPSRKQVFHKNPKHVERYREWLDATCKEPPNLNNEGRGACAVSVLGNIEWTEIPNRERSGSNERLSGGMDRYKSIGNTVIPQIPELIGRAIMEATN